MKICFLINQIHEGGAERVLCSLANQFCISDIDVHLITTKKHQDEYFLDETVKRFVLADSVSLKGRFTKNKRMVKAIREYCLANGIDVLISFMAESNFRAILACKNTKTKSIISIRNDPEKEYKSNLYKFMCKLLYKKADGVVFQTSYAKDYFSKLSLKRCAVISNPINEKFYVPYDINKAKGFVTVGRLVNQKNHRLLIDAFNLIKNDTNENLYIYGDGPLKQDLINLINDKGLQDRVFLLGQNGALESELVKYKVFVLSSDYEGMPNSLMEAMAVGLECISTDCPCGGPKFLFNNEQYGKLCTINNALALSKLMLLSISTTTNQESKEQLRAWTEQFKIDKIANKWFSLIKEIRQQ